MTAITFLDQKSHKISSLRRRDKLWIYKNPQGLLILEDELNEKRKKRFARQRASTPIQEPVRSDTKQSEFMSMSPLNKINSLIPDDAIIPIAIVQNEPRKSTDEIPANVSRVEAEVVKEINTGTNKVHLAKTKNEQKSKEAVGKLNLEKFVPKEAAVDRVHEGKPIKRNLISERSKMFQQDKEAAAPIKKESTSPKSNLPDPLKPENKPKKEIIPRVFMQSPVSSTFASPTREVRPSLAESFKSEPCLRKETATRPSPLQSSKSEAYLRSISQAPSTPKPEISSSTVMLKKIPKAFLADSEVLPIKKEISTQKPSIESRPSFQKKESVLEDPFNHHVPKPKAQIKSPNSTPPQNFLADAKKKLMSAQQKPTESKSTIAVDTNAKKLGLVSSFVSAFESQPVTEQKKIELSNDKNTAFRGGMPPKPRRHHESPTSPKSPSSPPVLAATKHKAKEANNLKLFSDATPINQPPFEQWPRTNSPSSDSTINIYLPRLSPDISFNDQDQQLTIPEKDDIQDEEDQERPVIKKRVSFSEQLLTYIPDDNNATPPKSLLQFADTLNQELSETKAKLIEERKVNTTPSREMFVPAMNKGPQKLSNKLLDMFQQKSTKPVKETSTPQPLVHLTKTRPRKPPSLKKPTFPAATAQPNWRNRATNKKYEFVA